MTSRIFELGRETQYAPSSEDWKRRDYDGRSLPIDVTTGKECLLPGHMKDKLPCLLATRETSLDDLKLLLGLDEQDADRIACNLVLLDLQRRNGEPCAILRWDLNYTHDTPFGPHVQITVAYGFVPLAPPHHKALFARIHRSHAIDQLARELETAYEAAGVADAQVDQQCAQAVEEIRKQAHNRRAAIEREVRIRLDIPKP